jgi:hypothetical protein
MAEVNVGRSRVSAKFDSQRLTCLRRFFQLRAQITLANDFGCAFAQKCELFVDSHLGQCKAGIVNGK